MRSSVGRYTTLEAMPAVRAARMQADGCTGPSVMGSPAMRNRVDTGLPCRRNRKLMHSMSGGV